LYRGFHSGALPKAYDRVRQAIERQLRDQALYPRRIRACERRLRDIEQAIGVFVERELSFALRERCRTPGCVLSRVEPLAPKLATNLVELKLAIRVRPPAPLPPPRLAAKDTSPAAEDGGLVHIALEISPQPGGILMRMRLEGDSERIGPRCRDMILEDLRVFAGRAGARLLLDPGTDTMPSTWRAEP
jgi:hypothetical protein